MLNRTFKNLINSSKKLSLQNSQQNNSNPTNLLSPSDSNSSGDSPQCTPLTPYNSFGKTIENTSNSRQSSRNFPEHRGTISFQLQYDDINTTLQVNKFCQKTL